jgi:dTDP-4-dehydrorhamnose reductase
MRVLILGASGMLGHKLYQRLQGRFDLVGTVRGDPKAVEKYGFFRPGSMIGGVDATQPESVTEVIRSTAPAVVINAIGVVKQLPEASDVARTLAINSIFPHHLAKMATEFGFRLITMSTDCVFAGNRGNYAEDETADAIDLYGASKRFGEIDAPNVLTIRTSIIGRELATSNGLLEWLLSQAGGSVKGFTHARFNGFTTLALSGIIEQVIAEYPAMYGIRHISSDPISKFDLLSHIADAYGLNVQIDPSGDLVIDRTLDSARFRREAGFIPDPWTAMLAEMAEDPTPYDEWRGPRAV